MNWNKGMKWIVAVFAVLVLMSVFVGGVSADGEVGTPDITVTPSEIYIGDTVTVTANADNATEYDISCSDAVSSKSNEGNGATFVFESAKQYTITVVAKNGDAQKTNTNTKQITVKELDSIAETIALTVTTPVIGVTVPNSATTTIMNYVKTSVDTALFKENAESELFKAVNTVKFNKNYESSLLSFSFNFEP